MGMREHALRMVGPGPDQPSLLIEPQTGLLRLDLRAVWQYRELLYFLVWRDVKVRYKQTLIGAAWAIIQPLATMVIFTVIFGTFARLPSDGLPYPIFAYAALLPWTYFSQATMLSTASLVSNAGLIKKVFFPRLIVPLSAVVTPIVDFGFGFLVLLGLMMCFSTRPSWGVLVLPFFLLLAATSALAVGTWLSALNVIYRDVGHVIPFLVQVWMYVTPIVYPASLVPERWRLLYRLNPMAVVIDGFRWGLLGSDTPDARAVAFDSAAVILLLLSGGIFFKWAERRFADLI